MNYVLLVTELVGFISLGFLIWWMKTHVSKRVEKHAGQYGKIDAQIERLSDLTEIKSALKESEEQVRLKFLAASEQLSLTRVTKEQQYASIHELQNSFATFMALYREMSSPYIDISKEKILLEFEERCINAETMIDGVILRITTEFGPSIDKSTRDQLATLRQAVQTWRSTVRDGDRVRFGGSNHPDYYLFKKSFSNTMAFLLKELHKPISSPEIASSTSEEILEYIFDNDREADYEQQRDQVEGA